MEAKKVIQSINRAIEYCLGLGFDEGMIDKREKSETPEGLTKYTRAVVDELTGWWVVIEVTYGVDTDKIKIDFTRQSGKVIWKASTEELLKEITDHYIQCLIEKFFKRTGY